MILIDTNIIVYLLIEGDHTEAAQELRRRDPDWHSEAFLMVEFTNVLAASVAAKRMNLALAQLFLVEASSLLNGKLCACAGACNSCAISRQRV